MDSRLGYIKITLRRSSERFSTGGRFRGDQHHDAMLRPGAHAARTDSMQSGLSFFGELDYPRDLKGDHLLRGGRAPAAGAGWEHLWCGSFAGGLDRLRYTVPLWATMERRIALDHLPTRGRVLVGRPGASVTQTPSGTEHRPTPPRDSDPNPHGTIPGGPFRFLASGARMVAILLRRLRHPGAAACAETTGARWKLQNAFEPSRPICGFALLWIDRLRAEGREASGTAAEGPAAPAVDQLDSEESLPHHLSGP